MAITVGERSTQVPANLGTKTIKFSGETDEVTIGSTEKSLVDHYGKTVDNTFFSSVEGIDWQLYYDDDEYIFLIASDYVEHSKLPSELIRSENKERGAGFSKRNSSTGEYEGTILETAPWSNGAASATITNNPLTEKYLKWALISSYYNGNSLQAIGSYVYDGDTNVLKSIDCGFRPVVVLKK